MNFLVLFQTIALWCGVPSGLYGLTGIQECRDKMIDCVRLRSEGLNLDFDTVSACFRSMSFGEIRKPVPMKKK